VSRTPYVQVRQAGREAVRQLILDSASRLLETEGPQALTMRRIAAEIGCSTTVLYTVLGGKIGIAEALWLEGFDRLNSALANARAQAGGDGPLQRLTAIGQAYRANALANRSYYAIMFQRPIPGFQPSADAYQESLKPLTFLVDAVEACIAAGVFRPGDPHHIATVLWAAVHGAVSLELAGYEGATDPEATFADLTAAAGAWFVSATSPSVDRPSDTVHKGQSGATIDPPPRPEV
jgi:AcrR family transcriptional regulator